MDNNTTLLIITLVFMILALVAVIFFMLFLYVKKHYSRMIVVRETMSQLEELCEEDKSEITLFFNKLIGFEKDKAQRIAEKLIEERKSFYKWSLDMYFNRKIVQTPKLRTKTKRLLKPYFKYMRLLSNEIQNCQGKISASADHVASGIDYDELLELRHEVELAKKALSITYKEYINLFNLEGHNVNEMGIVDIAESLGIKSDVDLNSEQEQLKASGE